MSRSHGLLPAAPPRESQPLPAGQAMARGRVHEICGPARTVLAAMVMAQSRGPVLWTFPGWQAGRVFPGGLAPLADPGRVIFARARRVEDILWTAEEALRSGAVPLVLADLPDPPGLTPVRRLHLAAEAGGALARPAGRPAPLGLLLLPADGGAPGVESRWHMDFAPSGSSLIERRAAWRMERRRARMAPPAAWHLAEGPQGLQAEALSGAAGGCGPDGEA